MPIDGGSSFGPRSWLKDLSPALAGCVREGDRLARTPADEQDLAWHVKAFYVGDLGALAATVLRSTATPAATR